MKRRRPGQETVVETAVTTEMQKFETHQDLKEGVESISASNDRPNIIVTSMSSSSMTSSSSGATVAAVFDGNCHHSLQVVSLDTRRRGRSPKTPCGRVVWFVALLALIQGGGWAVGKEHTFIRSPNWKIRSSATRTATAATAKTTTNHRSLQDALNPNTGAGITNASATTDEPVEGPPVELDVTSPMRQTGNPIIQQTLPVAFGLTLSVLPTKSRNVLLEELEPALETYLQRRYRNLIELQEAVFGSASAASLELQLVELDLAILGEVPGGGSGSGTGTGGETTRNGSGRKLGRQLQESTDLVTVQGVGEIRYSMQVDGSNPTPDEVQGTWNAVLEEELMTQARIEEVIGDTGISGVVRVDQVNVLDSSEVTETENEGAGETLTTENGAESEGSSNTLTRPSTLSIIFGFVLVAIASIGLIAYGFIFYRKRQKRLRKKRQMQETISYPSTSAAAAAASAAASASASSTSNTTKNANNISGINSSMTSNSRLPITPVPPTNPMIVARGDDEFSEDTSYKGLESSMGSEGDPSDSFAKELQLAASLDQEAWDEFQKKKDALDKDQALRATELGRYAGDATAKGKSEQDGVTRSPPTTSNKAIGSSLVGGEDAVGTSIDDEDGIEANLDGNAGHVRSFPYGDERPENERQSDVSNVPAWEPYNSAVPTSPHTSGISEEKKEELSPTSFFAQQLENIESDLARFNRAQERRSHDDGLRSPPSTDDLATSDVVTEVDELCRYVRKYERKKERKLQRESKLHGRLHAARSGSLSIGMDGRVYFPNQSDPKSDQLGTISNSFSSSLSPPSIPSREREDPHQALSEATSYAESYKMHPSQRTREGNLGFMSDNEDESVDELYEESERTQRIGIRPFEVSPPDQKYLTTSPKQENSNHSSPIQRTESRSHSSHKSRLADLRATDAIIDASQSEVNIGFDRDQMAAAMAAAPQVQPATISAKGGRISRLGVSPKKPSTNKRFDKLKGIFEQKTNEQPAPIYPPDEHWQYGVHK